MKIFFLFLISFLILVNCGKKSDPQYQGKIVEKIKVI